jgi:plastocyanin domain-containing protein
MKKSFLTLSFLGSVVLNFGMTEAAFAANAIPKQGPNQVVEITVTDHGFEPKSVDVKPGTNVTLEVTRRSEQTCATKIQVPSKKVMQDLPLNQKVTIALGVLKKGEIRYGCSENMMESAKIVVH